MNVDHFRMTLVWPLRLTGVVTQRDLNVVTKAIEDSTLRGAAGGGGADGAGEGGNGVTGGGGTVGGGGAVGGVRAEKKPWKIEENSFTPDSPDATRFAEFVYFHPFVRRFLYEPRPEKSPVQTLTRTDIRYLKTTIAVDPEGWSAVLPKTVEVSFLVESIRLHLFRTGVAVLSVELLAEKEIPLAVAESALDQVRRAYRPYFEEWRDGERQYKAGHCPFRAEWEDGKGPCGPASDYDDLVGHWAPVARTPASDHCEDERQPPFAAHWLYLLPELAPKYTFLHLLDERIPAMAFIAVKEPAKLSDGDFFRLGYLDEQGSSTTLPYSTESWERFKRESTYDRFWDPGRRGHEWMTTRYLTMGYSFVMVGSSFPGGFFMDGKSGALSHFRHHYYQLFLVAHFQHASLINFSHALATLVDDIVEASTAGDVFGRMDDLQARFADFVSRFWFDEVSNQLQARELFDLIRANLGTERLYRDVTNEIKSVAEVIAGRVQARIGNFTLGLTLAAVFLGLMQLTKVRDAFVDWINGRVCTAGCPMFEGWHLELAVFSVGAVAAWVLHRRIRLPSGSKTGWRMFLAWLPHRWYRLPSGGKKEGRGPNPAASGERKP